MTVGHVVLLVVGLLTLWGLVFARVYQRSDNGHWGRARGWMETTFWDGFWVAVRDAFLGALVLAALTWIVSLFLMVMNVRVDGGW